MGGGLATPSVILQVAQFLGFSATPVSSGHGEAEADAHKAEQSKWTIARHLLTRCYHRSADLPHTQTG